MSQRVEESFGRDSLGLYLDEIARTPLLSAEQEVELAKAMESGLEAEYILDPEAHPSEELDENKILALKKLGELATTDELEWMAQEGRRAKQQFINANLGLAVSVARKYAWSGLPLLDRIQDGNLGIIRAVEKFDYTQGNKFSTYAQWWIHREIKLGIANQERMIRLPREVQDEIHVMNTAERSLVVKLGREPEPAEIAAEADTTPQRVVKLRKWRNEHLSLDGPVLGGEGDATLADLIPQETMPSADETLLDVDKRERVLRLIDQLGEGRQKDIIMLRFGINTDEELIIRDIGEVVNLSPAGTSRELNSALGTLRQMVPDRESFDNSPADMNIAADLPKEPGKQNQRLITIAESKVLQGLIRDGLDMGAAGLSETEIAMLTLYSQKRSNSAVQRKFGTKPARTKTILKKCIDAVRSDIDAAMGMA